MNMRNMDVIENKNAFQWDAYRPLVDRIPACIVQGAVSAQGGVCTGGVSARGWDVYPIMQWGRHPPADRQTPVKT